MAKQENKEKKSKEDKLKDNPKDEVKQKEKMSADLLTEYDSADLIKDGKKIIALGIDRDDTEYDEHEQDENKKHKYKKWEAFIKEKDFKDLKKDCKEFDKFDSVVQPIIMTSGKRLIMVVDDLDNFNNEYADNLNKFVFTYAVRRNIFVGEEYGYQILLVIS
jgi:hypothetical protein